jgi:hypothetical protein
MITGSDRLQVITEMRIEDPETSRRKAIKTAVESGLAIVLLAPGTKDDPLCTLPRTKRGKRDHHCGSYHALTDPEEVYGAYKNAQDQYPGQALNIGIHARKSNLAFTDVDTPGQLDAFLSRHGSHPLTVSSPGKQNDDGEWAHYGGGHIYFDTTGIEMPPERSKYVHPEDGWVLMWGDLYVVAPPSIRAEGPYVIKTPEVPPLPSKLIKLAWDSSTREHSGPRDGPTDIDVWSEGPWTADLLRPEDGWVNEGRRDSCGCPIWWVRGRSDHKSATAHEITCSSSSVDTSCGHGPLQLWTDAPPDFLREWRSTHSRVTKIRYLALRDFDGDIRAACEAEGIAPETVTDPDWEFKVPDDEASKDESEGKWSRKVDLGPYLNGTHVRPQPAVGGARDDEKQLIYPTRWHTVIGLTTAGKTTFALWHIKAVLETGGHVAYLHFEEHDPGGILDRLQGLGVDGETLRKQFHWYSCEKKWAPGEMAYRMGQLEQPPDLAVLDGINAACSQHGWPHGDPSAIGDYRAMFVTPLVKVGAAILSLGHPPKGKDRQNEMHGFGSTAWLDEVDGVGFRMVPSKLPMEIGKKGYSELYVVKDRYSQVKRWGVVDTTKDQPWYYMGAFIVDDTQTDLELFNGVPSQTLLRLNVPKEVGEGQPKTKPAVLADNIEQALQPNLEKNRTGYFGSIAKLKAMLTDDGVQYSAGHLTEALELLVLQNRLAWPEVGGTTKPRPGWLPGHGPQPATRSTGSNE